MIDDRIFKVGDKVFCFVKQRNKVIELEVKRVNRITLDCEFYDTVIQQQRIVSIRKKIAFTSPKEVWTKRLQYHQKRIDNSMKAIEGVKKKLAELEAQNVDN